jgi:uncharacterized protein
MKKNKAPLTQPLSERELDWLQNFLENLSQTYDDCMTLEEVDGLFCALIINPVMAKPSEWMKTVFGKEHNFSSEEELERVMMLLIRYWNHISGLVENPPKTEKDEMYFPRVVEFEEDSSIKLAEKWAAAFHIGVSYCADDWDEALKDSKSEFISQSLATIMLLELGYNPDDNGAIITPDQRRELLVIIPVVTYKLFHYWVEKNTTEKKESKTKVGRNDPCPCGSGKKYKKCCDA